MSAKRITSNECQCQHEGEISTITELVRRHDVTLYGNNGDGLAGVVADLRHAADNLVNMYIKFEERIDKIDDSIDRLTITLNKHIVRDETREQEAEKAIKKADRTIKNSHTLVYIIVGILTAFNIIMKML